MRVVANPGDHSPSVEIHTSDSAHHCENGAETDDERDVASGGHIYVAMCEIALGTLELRNPTTSTTLATYHARGSATPTPTPHQRPT